MTSKYCYNSLTNSFFCSFFKKIHPTQSKNSDRFKYWPFPIFLFVSKILINSYCSIHKWRRSYFWRTCTQTFLFKTRVQLSLTLCICVWDVDWLCLSLSVCVSVCVCVRLQSIVDNKSLQRDWKKPKKKEKYFCNIEWQKRMKQFFLHVWNKVTSIISINQNFVVMCENESDRW
jgi:hypothetical protein